MSDEKLTAPAKPVHEAVGEKALVMIEWALGMMMQCDIKTLPEPIRRVAAQFSLFRQEVEIMEKRASAAAKEK